MEHNKKAHLMGMFDLQVAFICQMQTFICAKIWVKPMFILKLLQMLL